MSDTTREPNCKSLIDATRVARRSLVLAAIVCRGDIESGAGQPEAEALYDRIIDWIIKLDLWDEVEPNEERILKTPLGRLERKETIQATWFVEGLSILAWALDRLDLPRHDEKVDAYTVAESVSFLDDDAFDLIRTAALRNQMEIDAYRELVYAIHTRLRDFIRNGGKKDFRKWVQRTWTDELDVNIEHLIVDKDLAIGDKPISKVGDDRLQECAALTVERHRAIIWLVEGYPSYSQASVDT